MSLRQTAARSGSQRRTRAAQPSASLAIWSLLLAGLSIFGPIRTTWAAEGAPSSHQPFGAANSDWDGHSEWLELARRVLGPSRVLPRASLDFAELGPEDAVIFFHPEKPLRADSLARFMNAGGRVAVFDDYGEGSTLWRRFSIRDNPGPLEPLATLLDNPALPIAEPHLAHGPDEGRHPMVSGADRVVTNHPIILEHPGLTALLEFPTRRGPRTLAVTGVIEGRGRLVVCGDSSVFLNLMLRYPGNRAFAEGIVRYLLEREDPIPKGSPTATGRLYVLSGDFDQVGDYGHQSFDEQIRERIDGALSELRKAFEGGLPPALCSALGLVLVLALIQRIRSQGNLSRVHIVHGFTKNAPPAPNPHLRLDLLSAPSTTPLLALAELSIALESLVDEAGQTPSRSGEEEARLQALRQDLARYKRQLPKTERKVPAPRELEELYQRARQVIDSVEATVRRKPNRREQKART